MGIRFWLPDGSRAGRFEIGQMLSRQLPFLTIIVLFWIMAIMGRLAA